MTDSRVPHSISQSTNLSSHLNACLELGAAVGQDAESQIQDLPGTVGVLEQVQKVLQSTSSSEPGDPRAATLDMLCPDGH